MDAACKEIIDVGKHMKDISVRYISSIMPSVADMDNYIVLPLFQRDHDIPIDNDGRTAIVLLHVPSLEKLLDLWKEKTAEQEAQENLRCKKGEKRNAYHERPDLSRIKQESLQHIAESRDVDNKRARTAHTTHAKRLPGGCRFRSTMK